MQLKSYWTGLFLLLSLGSCTFLKQQNPFANPHNLLDSIHDALIESQIIPEVLDDFQASCILYVSYLKKDDKVWMGNTLKPSHTEKEPHLKISCPNKGTPPPLTVALTDPDAPSREDPKWSEMCHWIATIPENLMRDAGDGGVVLDGQDLGKVVSYKAPGPPKKTGPHRYVFVLLQGDNTNLTAPSDREHWGTGAERHGVRDWAHQEGLEVVGANFFYAQNKKQ